MAKDKRGCGPQSFVGTHSRSPARKHRWIGWDRVVSFTAFRRKRRLSDSDFLCDRDRQVLRLHVSVWKIPRMHIWLDWFFFIFSFISIRDYAVSILHQCHVIVDFRLKVPLPMRFVGQVAHVYFQDFSGKGWLVAVTRGNSMVLVKTCWVQRRVTGTMGLPWLFSHFRRISFINASFLEKIATWRNKCPLFGRL